MSDGCRYESLTSSSDKVIIQNSTLKLTLLAITFCVQSTGNTSSGSLVQGIDESLVRHW
jgi:hypothetical protein